MGLKYFTTGFLLLLAFQLSGQNVGINHTNPQYTLDIRGTDDVLNSGELQLATPNETNFLRFFGGRIGDPHPFLAWHDQDSFHIVSTSEDFSTYQRRMTFLPSGKVGIGTDKPNAALHLMGASSIAFPNLRITDTLDAFARIKMETFRGGKNFWDVAASPEVGLSRFNIFYHSDGVAQGNMFSINGDSGEFLTRSFVDSNYTSYYRNISTYTGLTGFLGEHYFITNENANGSLRFGTNGETKMILDPTGKIGLGTLIPAAELDIFTADTDDGAAVHLANSDQSHFLRMFSGRENLVTPIIYWQHGDQLILGQTFSDDSSYEPFVSLNGKTIGVHNTGGSIYIGEDAGELAPEGSNSGNIAIGRSTLQNSVNRQWLVAIGDSALFNNSIGATSSTHGNTNMAIGYKAMRDNTLGHDNLAIGSLAMILNGAGSSNTAVGQYALRENTEGSFNVAFGGGAMWQSSGGNNLAIGYNSLFNVEGIQNTALGNNAMLNAEDAHRNTAIGYRASGGNVNGSDNTILGYQAGGGFGNTNYSGNILIGSRAGESITESNRLYIENSSSTSPLIYGEFNTNLVRINGNLEYTGSLTDVSDVRLKKNIIDVSNTLEHLQDINPVSYEMRTDIFEKDFNSGREYGVIAQQLEDHFPLLVVTGRDGYKSVDYTKLSVVLLKGIQEQQHIISNQNQELTQMRLELDEVKKQVLEISQFVSKNSNLVKK